VLGNVGRVVGNVGRVLGNVGRMLGECWHSIERVLVGGGWYILVQFCIVSVVKMQHAIVEYLKTEGKDGGNLCINLSLRIYCFC
jgi:hypothetical protein